MPILQPRPARPPMLTALCLALGLTLALIRPAVAGESSPPAAPVVQRQYVDGPFGQIHLRIARPARRSAERHPPLICFHYSPGSSRMYAELMPHLATDRVVIAFDTPGYGGSDAPPTQPTLPQYALALTAGLERLGYGPRSGRKIDVVGHLTGSLIATELAATQPRWVRRVILSQAPNFDAARRRDYVAEIETMGATRQKDLRGQYLIDRLTRGLQGLGADEAPETYTGVFIDSVIPGHKWTYGEIAAISYPAEDVYPTLTQPVLLFTYQTSRPQDFERTAKLLRNVRVQAVADRGPRNWQTAPATVAASFREFLDAR